MEDLELKKFYTGKRVFVTGHTGFKGSWLSLVLDQLGAVTTGYALLPPTDPALFVLAEVENVCKSVIADVRDCKRLTQELVEASPEIVIHMAAQPLVRESYNRPVETYSTNVLGTVNVFEAVRQCPAVRAVVIVTTDKVYENRELHRGYREDEAVGGFDPYSSSKACAEFVTAAYRNSFFHPDDYSRHRVAVATARAGNVIGGGDWAADRLVPDSVQALLTGDVIELRNPNSVRPWQHVFEPLFGYLQLARQLCAADSAFSGAWNFGPDEVDDWAVEALVKELCQLWGDDASYKVLELNNQPHETHYLRLDSSKAQAELGWHPRWRLNQALSSIVNWSKAYICGTDMHDFCRQQIADYLDMSGE